MNVEVLWLFFGSQRATIRTNNACNNFSKFPSQTVDDTKEKRVLRTPTPLPKGGAASLSDYLDLI